MKCSVKKCPLFEPNECWILKRKSSGEFGHFSGMQSIFSEGIRALIFWFFCIKAKEQIIKVRAAPGWKNAKKEAAKAAHIAFFTDQRSDHVLEALARKRKEIPKS